MKRIIYLLLILVHVPLLTFAKNSGPVLFKKVDITEAVRFFESDLLTVEAPFKTYNWSVNGADGLDAYNTYRAQNGSKVFWQNFGSKVNSNMYGFGLYSAMDPLSTHSYGTGENYLIIEMQFPAGMRILDAQSQTRIPDNVKTLLTQFTCPGNIQDIFTSGGRILTEACAEFIEEIFKTNLKIDALTYTYGSTTFAACERKLQSKAFVITRPDWMKPELIRYYTSKSIQESESRRLIQTLFLNQNTSVERSALPADLKNELLTYLRNNPKKTYAGATTKCDTVQCIHTIRFCENNLACEEINLTPMPKPNNNVITADAAARTERKQLLWKDVEGMPKSENTEQWLKQNIFGCNGKSNYKSKEKVDASKSK